MVLFSSECDLSSQSLPAVDPIPSTAHLRQEIYLYKVRLSVHNCSLGTILPNQSVPSASPMGIENSPIKPRLDLMQSVRPIEILDVCENILAMR